MSLTLDTLLARHQVPTLTDADVHIWCLEIDSESARSADLSSLRPEEQARALAMSHLRSRATFVQARLALRHLLRLYLEVEPADVHFSVNHHGKPRLHGTAEHEGLVFNVSHSGDRVMIGLARNTPLGVDVERRRGDRDLERLAHACLSEGEIERWQALPPELKPEVFYRWWTAKEALVKAIGRGVALGLRSIEVGADDRHFRSAPAGWSEVLNWYLETWDLAGYSLALVCGLPNPRVSLLCD
jgi:4'-phosphopantetheinyl transferase